MRWTGDYASVFVPADVTRVYMPVRLPSNGGTARPMGVEVMSGGVRKGRTLVGDAWATIEVQLPAVPPPARFKRIDLKVDRTWQPAVYLAGNADLRTWACRSGSCRCSANDDRASSQPAVPPVITARQPLVQCRVADREPHVARQQRIPGSVRSGTSADGDGIGCIPCCSNASIDRRMCSGEVTTTRSVRPRSASIAFTWITSSRVFFDCDSSRIRSGRTPRSISARRSATDSGSAAGSCSVTPPDAITHGPFSDRTAEPLRAPEGPPPW